MQITEETLVNIDITLVNVPHVADLQVGIMRGRIAEQPHRVEGQEVTFRATAKLQGGKITSAYFQGTPTTPFIYIVWGVIYERESQIFRKIKLPVRRLLPETAQKAIEESKSVKVSIVASDKAGSPAQAYAVLSTDWHVA